MLYTFTRLHRNVLVQYLTHLLPHNDGRKRPLDRVCPFIQGRAACSSQRMPDSTCDEVHMVEVHLDHIGTKQKPDREGGLSEAPCRRALLRPPQRSPC